jgi:prefoldin subunit 4
LTVATYQVGELFINTTTDEAGTLIEKNKTSVQAEIAKLESQIEVHKGVLSELKVQLYAKFGSNINLEAEDD